MDEQVKVKLEAYIKMALQKGIDNEDIILKLKNSGFNEDVVEAAIKRVEAEQYFNYDESLYAKKRKIMFVSEKYGGKNQIRVEEIMTYPVLTVKTTDYVINAANIIYNKNISAVVVVDAEDDTKPVGMISTGVLAQILAENRDYRNLKVEEVMNPTFVTATPEDNLQKIGTLMRVNNCKHVLILKNSQLIGIITSTELIKLMALV